MSSSLYAHELHQQQQRRQLHHHHHHHHPATGCHPDRRHAIAQFHADPAAAAVLGSSLHRTVQQRQQPGTSFTAAAAAGSRAVPELTERACVDRYNYALLGGAGCDQFTKISLRRTTRSIRDSIPLVRSDHSSRFAIVLLQW